MRAERTRETAILADVMRRGGAYAAAGHTLAVAARPPAASQISRHRVAVTGVFAAVVRTTRSSRLGRGLARRLLAA
jgi:CO/xanthine dehydrogenase FAD-binding subunit